MWPDLIWKINHLHPFKRIFVDLYPGGLYRVGHIFGRNFMPIEKWPVMEGIQI